MVLGQRLDSAWTHTFLTVVACLLGDFSTVFAPDESIYSKENLEEPVPRKKKRQAPQGSGYVGVGWQILTWT